jgi:hypothetical protein
VVERSLAFGLDRWKMLRLIESVIGRKMRAKCQRFECPGMGSAVYKYKAYSPH